MSKPELALDVGPLGRLAGLSVCLKFSHRFQGKLATNRSFAGPFLEATEIAFGHHNEPAFPDG
jgi:hypothetical protein